MWLKNFFKELWKKSHDSLWQLFENFIWVDTETNYILKRWHYFQIIKFEKLWKLGTVLQITKWVIHKVLYYAFRNFGGNIGNVNDIYEINLLFIWNLKRFIRSVPEHFTMPEIILPKYKEEHYLQIEDLKSRIKLRNCN